MSKKNVLLIEDNEDDVFFMRRAFRAGGMEARLHIVADGETAIEYLSGHDAYADRSTHPLPHLILLDLKLPRRSGLEVLDWIRSNPATKTLRVVILTSSSEKKDIEAAARIGANSYLVKPSSVDDLVGLIGLVKQYWLQCDRTILPG